MPETIPERLDRIEATLDNLPEGFHERYRTVVAVIVEVTEDWPRDAYPRLTRLSKRAAKLWIELDAQIPTRPRGG